MADPIWLQKLKKRFGQSLSSERITPERPNFTGTAGYNKPSTVSPDYENVLGLGRQGALVDPHLAAAAGGPGWGSGMAPSTMTKVPASGKKGLSMKSMIKALTEMKKPAALKAPAAKLMGEARPQLPAPPPFAALGGVNQSIMNVGGLGDEANERWRKIMGYS